MMVKEYNTTQGSWQRTHRHAAVATMRRYEGPTGVCTFREVRGFPQSNYHWARTCTGTSSSAAGTMLSASAVAAVLLAMTLA